MRGGGLITGWVGWSIILPYCYHARLELHTDRTLYVRGVIKPADGAPVLEAS